MSDLTAIADLINSTGFPIFSTCMIGYLFYREQNAHKEESNQFTEAINNLTVALTKLSEKLGGDEGA